MQALPGRVAALTALWHTRHEVKVPPGVVVVAAEWISVSGFVWQMTHSASAARLWLASMPVCLAGVVPVPWHWSQPKFQPPASLTALP